MAPAPVMMAVARLPPGGIRQEALAAMAASTPGKVALASSPRMVAGGGSVVLPRLSTRPVRVGAEAFRGAPPHSVVALVALKPRGGELSPLCSARIRGAAPGGRGAESGGAAPLCAARRRIREVEGAAVEGYSPAQDVAKLPALVEATVRLVMSEVRVPMTCTSAKGTPRARDVSQRKAS